MSFVTSTSSFLLLVLMRLCFRRHFYRCDGVFAVSLLSCALVLVCFVVICGRFTVCIYLLPYAAICAQNWVDDQNYHKCLAVGRCRI